MAAFVVALKWSPADYYAMTWEERTAIADELNRQNRRV